MTTPPLPFGQPSERERRRNPRLLILLLVALCMIFVAGYFERLSRLDATREAVDEMRQQVTASQQRNANLQEELKRVQDPYYLALMARDGIGLVQEGICPSLCMRASLNLRLSRRPNKQRCQGWR
ncbi:MAG: septum formation initiator family protein [Anaerolineales bacterium]|nr:septum formation initiator family protein [Anaerolineales bacterium]